MMTADPATHSDPAVGHETELLLTRRQGISHRLAEHASGESAHERRQLQRYLEDTDRALIARHRGLVLYYVRRFRAATTHQAVEAYIAAGEAGLAEAIASYDAARGRFSVWAYNNIRWCVLDTVWQIEFPHLSRSDFQNRGRLLKAIRLLQSDDETYEPDDEELALAADLALSTVIRVRYQAPLTTLDHPNSPAEPRLAVTDNVPDIAAQASRTVDASRANSPRALQGLTTRQRHVLARRFGLDGEDPATLTDIAYETTMNRETVRHIEHAGLQQLRRYLGVCL